MNANEYVEKLNDVCKRYAGCHDGCPFYTNEHEDVCCELAAATGHSPYTFEPDSQEEQTNDSDVESTLEQVAEESPNITINAKEVYVSFYK